jgi:hypothetical protein
MEGKRAQAMIHVWATIDDTGVIDERTVRTSRDQAIAAFLVEHRTTEPLYVAWMHWERKGFRCERFRLVASPAPAQQTTIVHGMDELPGSRLQRLFGDPVKQA